MQRPASPYALGATLYMPIVHPDALDVLLGRKVVGLRSVVLCLEDALAETDVEAGLATLRRLVGALLDAPPRDPAATPLAFLRPRNLDMAARIATWDGLDAAFHGIVAPKVRPTRVSAWRKAVEGTELLLMPTLETEEILDPVAVRDLRDELVAEGGGRILALRVGGNDLLSCLGLRRMRGATLYEGPLVGAVSTLLGLMVPAGFRLTSPVFEILDQPGVFAEELRRDVAWGFVGKTAIHPSQVPAVHTAFAVAPDDLLAAERILDAEALAVFKHGGAMCEPATHRAWARSVVERHAVHGLTSTDATAPGSEPAESLPG